jgi:hypothetical protein
MEGFINQIYWLQNIMVDPGSETPVECQPDFIGLSIFSFFPTFDQNRVTYKK